MKSSYVYRFIALNLVIAAVLGLMFIGIPAAKSAYHRYQAEQIEQERQAQIDSLSDEDRVMYEFYESLMQSVQNPPNPKLVEMRMDAMVDYCPELLEDPWFHDYYDLYKAACAEIE